MKKKAILLTLLSCIALVSCGAKEESESTVTVVEESESTNTAKSSTSKSASSKASTASSASGSTSKTTGDSASATAEATTPAEFSYGVSDDFMSTEDGYFVKEENTYYITTGGTYSMAGTFSGKIYICVDTPSKDGVYDVELDLNGVTLTNNEDSCIYAAEALTDTAAYDLSISAKNGTTNTITDTRSLQTSEEDTTGSAAIYSEVDLKLKGKGSLSVEGTYNNGIHSKDDLDIKNLTLSVKAPNNALKGNDSVTIESGNVTVISTGGDGIKTSNTGLTSKGKQKGTVTITSGKVDIYSCCDGIDAAYNVEVGGDAVVNVYTSNYSEYSEEVVSTSSTLYLCVSSSGGGRSGQSSSTGSYRYAAYFYNDSLDEGVWADFTSISSSGMGGSSYYSTDLPSGYSNIKLFKFNSSTTTNSLTSYVAASSGGSINTAYDMIKISSSSSSTTLSLSYSTYSTQSQGGGQGSFGPGGMDSGNSDKSEYSAKGFKAANEINITGGTITIKSYDDAIHVNNDETIESTAATGLGNVNISGGTLTLTAADDGIHADQDLVISGTANITVVTAYEGLEANRIYFNGGTTDVYATDDAVNAAACNGAYNPLVSITDGFISLEVGKDDTDTLDTNGDITISGGVLVIKNQQSGATSQTGGTIDLDGTLTVTGGVIISCGTWCTEANLSCSVTNTSTTLSSGEYTLQDSTGTVIATFTIQGSVKGYRIYMGSLTGTYTLYYGTTAITTFTKN